MAQVEVPRGIASGFLVTHCRDIIQINGGKLLAPLWAAAIAGVVERHYRGEWRSGEKIESIAKTAIERCKRDPDSHSYIGVILYTKRDDGGDDDVVALKQFAGVKPRHIRCKCGQGFTWPDQYQQHALKCKRCL